MSEKEVEGSDWHLSKDRGMGGKRHPFQYFYKTDLFAN